MRAVLSLATSAALLLCTGQAQAVAEGRVTSGQFSYTLIDLDEADGITPSISFQPVQAYPDQAPWGRYGYQIGPDYMGDEPRGSGPGPFSYGMRGPGIEADGRAAGQDEADPFALELSARIDGAAAGDDLRWDGFVVSHSQGFVLSANTGIIIESRGSFEGRVDRYGESFDGGGQLYLSSLSADGTPAGYARGEFFLASLAPGESRELERDFMVDVMYWNQLPRSVEGRFDLSVFVYAVSPVPEPASGALAALGAACVLLRSRRRLRKP